MTVIIALVQFCITLSEGVPDQAYEGQVDAWHYKNLALPTCTMAAILFGAA